jgi:hypothetical protein
MCTFRFLDPDFILASLDSFSISRSVRPLYTGGVPCIRYSSVRRRLSPYMDLWGKLLFRISREPTYRSASNFVGRKRTSIPIDRYACHNFPFPFPVYRNFESLHVFACGETSKNHNSGTNRDSDFRFSPVDSSWRAPSYWSVS